MRSRIALFLIFFIIHTSHSLAQEIKVDFSGVFDKKGVPPGWKLKEKTGKAEFRFLEEGGERVLYFRCVNASFSLELELRIDPKRFQEVVWSWKVLQLPEGADVRVKSRNDQAAQAIVLFEGGKSISYIWDTSAPEGTVTEESVPWPVGIKIKVLVVKSGTAELGRWITIKRNLHDDYLRLFNEEPSFIKGIRIQINTQYTGTVAEALFGGILFRAL